MAAVFVDSSHILLLCCYISPNNKTHTRFSKYSSGEVTSSSYPSRVSFDSLSRRRQRRILLSVSGREIADVRVADNSNNVHHTRSAFVEIPVTCYQVPCTRFMINLCLTGVNFLTLYSHIHHSQLNVSLISDWL